MVRRPTDEAPPNAQGGALHRHSRPSRALKRSPGEGRLAPEPARHRASATQLGEPSFHACLLEMRVSGPLERSTLRRSRGRATGAGGGGGPFHARPSGPQVSLVATVFPARPEWIHGHRGPHDKHRSRESMNDHTPDTVGVDISKAHLDVHRRASGRFGAVRQRRGRVRSAGVVAGRHGGLGGLRVHGAVAPRLRGGAGRAAASGLRERDARPALRAGDGPGGQDGRGGRARADHDGGRGGTAARRGAAAGAAGSRRTADGAGRPGEGPARRR